MFLSISGRNFKAHSALVFFSFPTESIVKLLLTLMATKFGKYHKSLTQSKAIKEFIKPAVLGFKIKSSTGLLVLFHFPHSWSAPAGLLRQRVPLRNKQTWSGATEVKLPA